MSYQGHYIMFVYFSFGICVACENLTNDVFRTINESKLLMEIDAD